MVQVPKFPATFSILKSNGVKGFYMTCIPDFFTIGLGYFKGDASGGDIFFQVTLGNGIHFNDSITRITF